MVMIGDFWRQGALRGIESAAARRAVAEARQRWLRILEDCIERDEDGVDEHVHAEIRRLHWLLGLPAGDPLPGMVERRRQQVRERARRFRERRANRVAGCGSLIARRGPALSLPELCDRLADAADGQVRQARP